MTQKSNAPARFPREARKSRRAKERSRMAYTSATRAALIVNCYDWLFDETDSFEPYAMDLAYLWPAILKGGWCDLPATTPLLKLLVRYEDRRIWDFLVIHWDS